MTQNEKTLAVIMLVLLSMAAMACSSGAAAQQTQMTPTPPADSTPIPPDSGNQMPSQSDPAALRATLTTLLQEHLYLTLAATQAVTNDDDSEEEVKAVLDQRNSVVIADLVGELHGQDMREEFLQLWRNQIGYYYDFARATADDDEDDRDIALESLWGFVQELTSLMTGANPQIAEDEFRQELTRYIELTLLAIAYEEGEDTPEDLVPQGIPDDADSKYEAAVLAGRQAAQMAAALTPAIVAGHPEQLGGTSTPTPDPGM